MMLLAVEESSVLFDLGLTQGAVVFFFSDPPCPVFVRSLFPFLVEVLGQFDVSLCKSLLVLSRE